MDKGKLLNELQMLTGLITNDYEYMLYMLLKDGSKFRDTLDNSKYERNEAIEIDTVQCLDNWFGSLMEVVDD